MPPPRPRARYTRLLAFALVAISAMAADEAIVLPQSPTPTEVFAAAELERYVVQMTGAPPAGIAIHIGGAALADSAKAALAQVGPARQQDAYVVDGRTPGCLVLAGGGDRGTLYAVYDFLALQGCRWFMPGPQGEVVPQRDTLVWPDGLRLERPAFVQREICVGAKDDAQALEQLDWSVKNRINRDFGLRLRLPAETAKRGGWLEWQHICHNYGWVAPMEKYFKSNPEYYALFAGHRQPVGNEKGNLCTTNPELIQLAADFAARWFDAHPDGSVVPLVPMDGAAKWCECERCLALGGSNDRTGPSVSALLTRRNITFVNAVADLVRDRYPDRLISTLAYYRYGETVPELAVAPNVLIVVCHHGCMAHGLGACAENADAARRAREWAALAPGRTGIWDYFLLAIPDQSEALRAPLPFAETARDTIRLLDELDAPYFFTQAGRESWDYNPLPYYVTARLTWDPDQDFAALCDDFFARFYGAAAESAAAYHRLLEAANRDSDWHPTYWRSLMSPPASVYTPALLAELDARLADAEQQAQGDSERIRQRVARLRESYAFTRRFVTIQQLAGGTQAHWRMAQGDASFTINAAGQAIDPAAAAELRGQANADPALERILFRCNRRELPVHRLRNDRVAVDIVPELGGRVVRWVDLRRGAGLFRTGPTQVAMGSIGDPYLSYGGYEEYFGSAFASPGWETPFAVVADEGEGVLLQARVLHWDVRRRIRVPAGHEPAFVIETEIRNTADEARELRWRAHPELSTYRLTGERLLFARTVDDQVLRGATLADFDGHDLRSWGFWYPDHARGVELAFDAKSATPYLHIDDVGHFLTLETWSRPRQLAPEERVRFVQTYRVVDRAP